MVAVCSLLKIAMPCFHGISRSRQTINHAISDITQFDGDVMSDQSTPSNIGLVVLPVIHDWFRRGSFKSSLGYFDGAILTNFFQQAIWRAVLTGLFCLGLF